ncbi:hypothetical protein ATANTOWER_007466 [Ataeniobius toweri]|uniref:Uncharacterized protein n=1 Tax=Ataeniobius toweri TaxID=208326 RepID=A0ABU7CG42_9TELE|nr:hypothetical protein [Ataeniobius toweri]
MKESPVLVLLLFLCFESSPASPLLPTATLNKETMKYHSLTNLSTFSLSHRVICSFLGTSSLCKIKYIIHHISTDLQATLITHLTFLNNFLCVSAFWVTL